MTLDRWSDARAADHGMPRADLDAWRRRALALEASVNRVMVGMPRTVRLMLVSLFARGHVLLEGDVGVGKTTLLKAMARGIGGGYERIEGTVDLMPGDLVYHTLIADDGRPRVLPGPLLSHGPALSIFFFNEINRARPQVHALLLRVMAERTLNAFNREHRFPHVTVYADRNRVEREETFELPAAARDRFLMEIEVEAPAEPAQLEALMFDPRFHDNEALIAPVEAGAIDPIGLEALALTVQQEVGASAALRAYGVKLWQATREPQRFGVVIDDNTPGAPVDTAELVLAGASPRGMAMLARAARVHAWLEGRSALLPEDLQAVFVETVAHRIALQPLHEPQRGPLTRALARDVLRRVGAP